jgi:hypothetical protein
MSHLARGNCGWLLYLIYRMRENFIYWAVLLARFIRLVL